jgi:lysophospholipase L1-like esterase
VAVAFLMMMAGLLLQVVGLGGSAAGAVVHYRVLITGDSITQGSAGDYTWRYRLWTKLTSTAPGAVSFVGTRTTLYDNVRNKPGSTSYAAAFPAEAHSALWGDSYRAELGSIASQVKATHANVLIVMLGSNDLTYFTSPEQTIANVKTYIARARAAAPGIDIVVGEALNKWDPWAGEYHLRDQTSQYAARLDAMAAELDRGSQRVVVAPTRDGWDARTMTWDGTHPSPTGEMLIAQRVSEGLAKIGVGSASPSIVGPKAWSVPGPTPAAAPGIEKAKLSWDRSASGATGIFIEQRLINTKQAWLRLPYAVAADGWTDDLLAAGGTYQFRLVPSKGFNLGIAGPVRTVTVGGYTPGAIGKVGLSATGPIPFGWQRAVATWSRSTHAQGYLLSYRLMLDPHGWQNLPYAATKRSWNFEPFLLGRRYQVRVRGSRGFLAGVWKASPVVRTRGVPLHVAYVSMGDSYSSGLGSHSRYSDGSCMRASAGWPTMFLAGPVRHREQDACAGAQIPGVFNALNQVDYFLAQHRSDAAVITLTVGGNDVGFGDELEHCIRRYCVRDERKFARRIDQLKVQLVDLYRTIRAENPYADILVGGYPGVVEPQGPSHNWSCYLLDAAERSMINRLVTRMNTVIASAASRAGVWSVGQRVAQRFAGHNACTGGDGEWVNAVSIDGLKITRSFHPKDSGQYEYSEVFTKAYVDRAAS